MRRERPNLQLIAINLDALAVLEVVSIQVGLGAVRIGRKDACSLAIAKIGRWREKMRAPHMIPMTVRPYYIVFVKADISERTKGTQARKTN